MKWIIALLVLMIVLISGCEKATVVLEPKQTAGFAEDTVDETSDDTTTDTPEDEEDEKDEVETTDDVIVTSTFEETTSGLEDYPAPFIDGCNFYGNIVVGDSAPAEDVISAIDITSSLTSGTTSSGSFCAVIVSPALLASELVSIGSQNLIVIGNPCDNKITAEIMGSSSDCLADFEKDKAIIKLYETSGGKIAMIVAGYSTSDTRKAARVLKNYEDYSLSGDSVTVSGSLTNLVVS